MGTFNRLIPAVILTGMMVTLPRLAVAAECEGNECEQQPLQCPQSPGECQQHFGPATLAFDSPHQESSLDFSNVFVDQDDFGDPTFEGGTDYQVCIYQGEGLLTQWGARAGADYKFIDKKEARGLRYNAEVPGPDGMRSLLIRPDTTRIQEKAKKKPTVRKPPNGRLYSRSVTVPELPVSTEGNITAVFLNSNNACWSTTFTPANIHRNNAFRATIRRTKQAEPQ